MAKAKFLNIFGIANDFFGDSHFVGKKVKSSKPNTLHNLLPYRYYDEQNELYYNLINSVDGKGKKGEEETCGFFLGATSIVGCLESDIDILANFFNDNLPEGLILQIFNYASPLTGHLLDAWKQKRYEEGGIYKELADRRISHLNKARWRSLFSAPYVIRDFNIFISVSLSKKKYKNAETILKELRTSFINNLKNVSIFTKNQSPNELLSFLDEILSPDIKKTHRSIKKWDKLNPINIQASNSESELKINRDSVELSNQIHAKSFSVKSYPEIWGGWDMISLLGSEYRDELRIACPFISSLTIQVPNRSKSKSTAVMKNEILEPRSKSALARHWQDVDKMASDWKYVVDHLNKGHSLVQAKFSILLLCPKENLRESEEKLKAIYTEKGWDIAADNFFQLPSLLSNLPFYMNEQRFKDFYHLGKTRRMLSWTCANIAPFQGEYKGAIAQPYVMLTGKRGQPLFWNPYYSPEAGGNYNVVVTGKSGSGKSVFIQDLAASIRGAGGRLFVIDNGESFQNSSVLQEGRFIKVDQNISVNPFTMFDLEGIKNNAGYKTDVLNFFTSLLSQICRPISKINEDEKALITLACENVINQHGNKGSLDMVGDELLKVFKDEAQERACVSLKLSLDVFLKKYGNYFEGQSDIDLENKFLVFEMANLESGGMEDLKAVIMMLMMHLITEIIYKGDRVTRSALIIDEAWTMLKGGSMEEFIEGFVRRVRKFGGSLITASQNITDYYANPAAKAVLDNSQWKVFLAQNEDAVSGLKEKKIINMSPTLESSLKKIRMVSGCYAECLILGDSGWYVGRLTLDKFSIFLYSSKAEDVSALKKLRSSGLSIQDSILTLLGEKNG
jgi:conjugal transfer ATP-binding protein TraC